MKKIIATILCAGLIAIMAAGCGYSDALDAQKSAADATAASEQGTTAPVVKSTDYQNNFNGLCDYFIKKGYVTTGDKNANVVEMDASLIGATKGNKYTTSFDGKAITIELYELDLNNDTAKAIVESVKKDGTFTILDLPAVPAYISDNGKFLMVYTDASIDKEKPDQTSTTYIHREEVVKDFKEFNK